MRRTIVTTILSLFAIAGPAFAADPTDTTGPIAASAKAEALSAAAVATPDPGAIDHEWIKAQRRPLVLPALYVGVATLQALDVHTTLKALSLGGFETNPAMKQVVSNPALFIGVKAGLTAAAIVSSERMWKHHNRVGAIATMAVANGFMAWVAMHNAGVIDGMQR